MWVSRQTVTTENASWLVKRARCMQSTINCSKGKESSFILVVISQTIDSIPVNGLRLPAAGVVSLANGSR